MKRFLKRYWHWTLATLIFVLLLLVFADMNVFEYAHTRREVRRIKAETEEYRAQSAADSLVVLRMENDNYLERYAREQFYMHADDEEVYIIKEK